MVNLYDYYNDFPVNELKKRAKQAFENANIVGAMGYEWEKYKYLEEEKIIKDVIKTKEYYQQKLKGY